MKLKHILNNSFYGIVFTITIFSCTDKIVVRHNALKNDYSKIVAYMSENDYTFDTYSIKYTGRFITEDSDFRFRGILRIIKDKEIWISIAPVGVEAARILFTPNEIQFMNRQNNTYFIGNYNYFKKKFNIDINYSLLEQTLTNRFLFINNPNEPVIDVSEDGLFEFNDMEGINSLKYTINPSLRKLTSVAFKDFTYNSSISISFQNFIEVDSQKMPETILFEVIKGNKKHMVELNYKKITVDKKVATPFRVPAKYEQVWP